MNPSLSQHVMILNNPNHLIELTKFSIRQTNPIRLILIFFKDGSLSLMTGTRFFCSCSVRVSDGYFLSPERGDITHREQKVHVSLCLEISILPFWIYLIIRDLWKNESLG